MTSIDDQTNDNDVPCKTSKSSNEESLLALVSVRPPTPDKCAVCLNNKETEIIARIDSCSHTFCFSCILEWSKVRTICPLCKQSFNIIIRERYSGDIVEEICVESPRRTSQHRPAFNSLNDVLNWFDRNLSATDNRENAPATNVFRQMVYLEWLDTIQTLVPRSSNRTRHTNRISSTRSRNQSSSLSNLAPADSVRRLLHGYLQQTTFELRQSTNHSQAIRETVIFRKYIYINRLFVHNPVVAHDQDIVNIRECSPAWYTSNPACLHRLVPFLARELLALLWNDERAIENIIEEILTIIRSRGIRSQYFTRKLNAYLGRYTGHFTHEFYTFARCPYDLAGFDRYAQYESVNPSTQIQPSVEISLDDDNEQTPIIIDESSDTPISTIDIDSSPQAITTADFEQRSLSPECEIVEYVQPTIERPPSLIVLSEDEDNNEDDMDRSDNDTDESYMETTSSRKRRYTDNHETRSKRQQNTSIIVIHSPSSIILDDDETQTSNSSNHEQSAREVIPK